MKKKKHERSAHQKKNLSKDQDSETTHPASAEPSKFLQACLLHSIIITSCVLVPYLQQRIQKWLYSNIEGMSKSRARARLRKLGLLLEVEVKQKRISGQSSLARIFESVLLGGGELTLDVISVHPAFMQQNLVKQTRKVGEFVKNQVLRTPSKSRRVPEYVQVKNTVELLGNFEIQEFRRTSIKTWKDNSKTGGD